MPTLDRTPGAPRKRVTLRALRDYFPERALDRRLIPMPDYGCIYVKNAKVATSSLLLWLHRIHTGDVDAVVRNIHDNHALPVPTVVGWPHVLRMLSGEAFRFTFVRHPLPRVESAFLDKVVREKRPTWRNMVRKSLGVTDPDDGEVSFEQFVESLEVQDPIRMDPHWRPQHLNLMHPVLAYDFVGRLETFDADLAKVREATGMPDVPLIVRNKTAHDNSLLRDNPRLRRRLEVVYSTDMELYRY